MTSLEPRPHPIRDAAASASKVFGVLGSLVTALVGFGVLTIAQGDALTGLLGAIPGVITAVTTVLVAFRVARQAEPHVTPLAEPRNHDGMPLVVDRTANPS
ncbi:hypothetical protein LWC34_38805 [Kibdelosporangium philippinense]|uniref:Holin n=1 Tax=Kibdelosporangium philippinense TaxID=211113 RepID=A0ABS8ZLX8_9PSEU|nr:hypothetical protein [Kibdelosporangium philippinense]MCE7008720.1 hypothetical protein [Kibdelosporangium philippinense]